MYEIPGETLDAPVAERLAKRRGAARIKHAIEAQAASLARAEGAAFERVAAPELATDS